MLGRESTTGVDTCQYLQMFFTVMCLRARSSRRIRDIMPDMLFDQDRISQSFSRESNASRSTNSCASPPLLSGEFTTRNPSVAVLPTEYIAALLTYYRCSEPITMPRFPLLPLPDISTTLPYHGITRLHPKPYSRCSIHRKTQLDIINAHLLIKMGRKVFFFSRKHYFTECRFQTGPYIEYFNIQPF